MTKDQDMIEAPELRGDLGESNSNEQIWPTLGQFLANFAAYLIGLEALIWGLFFLVVASWKVATWSDPVQVAAPWFIARFFAVSVVPFAVLAGICAPIFADNEEPRP